MTAPALQAGDRVAYTTRWLRAVQAHDLAAWRGTVTDVNGPVVGVTWDHDQLRPQRVVVRNLVLVDRLHLEAP